MFIADTRVTIKESEAHMIETGMVEKLDEMLTANGVEHFFTLPNDTDEDGYAKDGQVLDVYYDASKDEITFSLVYMLWMKTVRNIEDEKVKEAMKKVAA